MLEVMELLAPKFGDTPSIPIGCNRLQPIGKFGVSTVLDFTVYTTLYLAHGTHLQ